MENSLELIEGRSPVSLSQIDEAIETGAGMEVIYLAGSYPGRKRLIFPKAVVGDLLHAQDDRSSSYRSFRVDKMLAFSESDPAKWAPKVLQSRKISDPAKLFSTWRYIIRKELWPALGVTLREYIDREPTKRAREAAVERGLDKKTVARISITFMSYAASGPDAADFHEGDIFYPVNAEDPALQVVRVGHYVEVHSIGKESPPRTPYRITPDELVAWLEFGEVPTHGRIQPIESGANVLFQSIR